MAVVIEEQQQAENQAALDEAAESLPGWINWVIDHLLLSCLLIAEAYILGTLMTLGWVKNIEEPWNWGIYHGIGVVCFFLAGATAAGVALRCSLAASVLFKKGKIGFALFNLLGMFVFVFVEVWASIAERSANLAPMPADNAVLQALGFPHASISPTVIFVSLLLPFASIYYGFSQQSKGHVSDADLEEQAKLEDFKNARRLARAKANAEIRTAQAGGLGGSMKAFGDSARGKSPKAS
jgi:hypothetical protein